MVTTQLGSTWYPNGSHLQSPRAVVIGRQKDSDCRLLVATGAVFEELLIFLLRILITSTLLSCCSSLIFKHITTSEEIIILVCMVVLQVVLFACIFMVWHWRKLDQ